MALNEIYGDGDDLVLPVPNGTASGAPVIVVSLVGVTQTAEGEGGNAEGFATVKLNGVHDLTVTGVTAVGTPIYITSGLALNVTAASNRLFGHAMEIKGASAGVIRVRVAGVSPEPAA